MTLAILATDPLTSTRNTAPGAVDLHQPPSNLYFENVCDAATTLARFVK
jgi:hypothetical protein